ncbi:DNA replication/repair protein RecF [Legionella israelensis]|uniref:DNA replication/repair protein RecF n=1 Tax=Legionella israelensis TaxID=454 RepID=UPI00117CA890|nr:DNA replication/repair protein RecF [Legionella israelensis]QDP71476.1 DNA replication/repair protein RecF [Legionella israelensis]
MILAELHIHNLRNISSQRMHLNPKINFIEGINGSGKTSFLEALYTLGTGHSFRSRDISSIIRYGEQSLTVFARSTQNDTISVQKNLAKPTLVKFNNIYCSSSSQLAYVLPIQVFYQDIFQIIDTGPSIRRRLLDWGLFHVKQSYLHLLNQYKRVLKQRNALLKQSSTSYHDFMVWDKQLSELAEQLHSRRLSFFEKWQARFIDVLSCLTNVHCEIRYYKGWDKKEAGTDLQTVLEKNFISDKQRLYTQYGAHQAEIYFEINEHTAKQVLSRGQQKMILIALKLSQAELINKSCLYLFDDFSAELDVHHQQGIIDYLISLDAQVILTSIDSLSSVKGHLNTKCSSFYMESGKIKSKCFT